jgi:hypothetical protein
VKEDRGHKNTNLTVLENKEDLLFRSEGDEAMEDKIYQLFLHLLALFPPH